MIINEKHNLNSFSKPEQEVVENEKQEWKLIDSVLLTRGLSLWAYNPTKKKLRQVKISYKDTVKLVPCIDNTLRVEDSVHEEVQIDPRDMHFESLNKKNAERRIRKYLNGQIKHLENLREAGGKIDFFN